MQQNTIFLLAKKYHLVFKKILAYGNVVEKFISQKGHNPFHGDLVHHPGLF